MTWMKGMVTAGLAAALLAGCSDRNTETRSERAAATTERAGERTAAATERAGERSEEALENAGERTGNALERGGEKVADAGREFAGTVKRVTKDTLEVGDREIHIGDDTEFFRDGKRVDRDEIRPGDEIRAAFDEAGDEVKEAGDKLEAKRIEIQRKAD